MKFVEICYPIKHAQGSFLWDAGVADAIAILPDSQRRRNLRMIRWPRPKTLASQSEQVGVKPTDGVTIVATPGHTPGH